MLFGKENSSISRFTKLGGFQKWKKSENISEHEASQSHQDSFKTERCNILGISIDDFIEEQITYEKKRWGEKFQQGVLK